MNLLAVAGGAAAVWHLVRAALRWLGVGVSGVWADEMARTHARHGDLTSLDEQRQEHARARRRARRAALEVAGWLALLVIPPLTSWPRAIYAGYALLWVPPAVRRVRAGRTGGPTGAGGAGGAGS